MKQHSEERLNNLMQLLFKEDSEVYQKYKSDLERLTDGSKKRILFVMETLAMEQIHLLTAIEVKRQSSGIVGTMGRCDSVKSGTLLGGRRLHL